MAEEHSARAVLDASAVLAYLQREPGYEQVRDALAAGAAISAVNLAEVYARVVATGRPLDAVATRLLALGLRPEPFIEEDARTSASLYPETQPLGLSLGDRACLALARRLGWPALTADRTWADAQLDVPVRLLR